MFMVKERTKTGKVNYTYDATVEDAANRRFDLAGDDATPTVTGVNTIANLEVVGGAGTVTATYAGGKVDKDQVVATFPVTWEANENAAAGDYEATITLTITSNS